MKAQVLLDGLHGHLREVDRHNKASSTDENEATISSRWQELRSKLKSAEIAGASAIPLSPLSQNNISEVTNKTDRYSSMSPGQKRRLPSSTSRQLCMASASPLTQRSSTLNDEANRLLER